MMSSDKKPKNYFVDTNVLISNPEAIKKLINGSENNVYIPYTVFMELNKLKTKPQFSHIISLVASQIKENQPFSKILEPKNDCLNYNTNNELLNIADNLIVSEILYSKIEDPILVSNDKLLRIQAEMVYNIKSEEFRDSKPFKSESEEYTGFIEYGENYITNCFYWKDGKLAYNKQGNEKIIDYDHEIWKIKPRTQYQNAAFELMLDDNIDIVTLQSTAGFGKTFLSLAAALYLMLENNETKHKFKKIYVIKPNIEIGREVGFLPGSLDEKLQYFFKPIYDLLIKLHEIRPANKLFIDPKSEILELNKRKIEFMPINFLRGMNIENSVVIIDECQNLSKLDVKITLSRMGENVKCFCVGDVQQIDNVHLNQYNNGLNWIVKLFMGQKNYGHLVLKGNKSRGPIADLVIKTGL